MTQCSVLCFSLFFRHRDEPNVPDSGATSDEENEDGDFTVYECPGLAPVRDRHTHSVLHRHAGMVETTIHD